VVGFGAFSVGGSAPRVGFRIGDGVLDLAAQGMGDAFEAPTLNPFLVRGRSAWESALERIAGLVDAGAELVPIADVDARLPFDVRDYVDFYSSLEHATNLGRMFRPDSEPLLPNWRRLPVGYHGRAGTVVVSGTPIVRPCGQAKAPADEDPRFGPSVRLDIELELGFVVGVGSDLGSPVPASRFRDHVFGVVLVNDWSARDIQAWEYQPLGPFLGKSFATSNGASLRTGDLMASGTISGSERGSEGSLIELTRNGAERLTLADGQTRAFLEDGDRVVLRGRAGAVALGETAGTVVPA
jgi:fumarylacetoacetase